MFKFPFYSYPYNNPYYKYYNKPIHNAPNLNNKKEESSITNSPRISNTTNQNSNNTQPIFEIWGIKLYTDDLIIIGLLYFLYQQNVKDEMLYIILFLLLFT